MKKMLKTLLLISMIVLTGCGVQETLPLVSDSNYYINYEMKYYYGEEGETFTIDLEKDFFSEGIIVSYYNDEITNLRDKYDSFELYVKLIDNKPVGYDYKIIDDFKAEVTFLDGNYPLYCRLINTKENKCSKAMLLGYTYVKQKDYIEVNSFEDLLQEENWYTTISNKTFILNKDLDFNDYQGVINVNKVKSLEGCTILNPNNYVIRNLDFKDEIELGIQNNRNIGLYNELNECYFDNLIFENVTYNFDAYDIESTSYIMASILGNRAIDCVFKNIKVNSLNVTINGLKAENRCEISGLVRITSDVAFVNNSINMNVIQTGEVGDYNGLPTQIVAGLASHLTPLSASDSNELYYGKNIYNYKRFSTRYNVVRGKIQGIDVIGGLFGVERHGRYYINEYNDIDIDMISQTNNIGEIYGVSKI